MPSVWWMWGQDPEVLEEQWWRGWRWGQTHWWGSCRCCRGCACSYSPPAHTSPRRPWPWTIWSPAIPCPQSSWLTLPHPPCLDLSLNTFQHLNFKLWIFQFLTGNSIQARRMKNVKSITKEWKMHFSFVFMYPISGWIVKYMFDLQSFICWWGKCQRIWNRFQHCFLSFAFLGSEHQ